MGIVLFSEWGYIITKTMKCMYLGYVTLAFLHKTWNWSIFNEHLLWSCVLFPFEEQFNQAEMTVFVQACGPFLSFLILLSIKDFAPGMFGFVLNFYFYILLLILKLFLTLWNKRHEIQWQDQGYLKELTLLYRCVCS